MEYTYLFMPIKIGSITVNNRISFAPHGTSFAKDSILDDRYVEYMKLRAKGGVGLIIAGGMTIAPSTKGMLNIQEIFEERSVPMLKRLSDSVHPYGTKIIMQLSHCGRQMESGHSRQPLLAPSAIPCPVMRETPKEMETADIKSLVQAFALSALHSKKGGMDGVEIHGTNGYLLNEFMSPYFNKRTDDYGGNLENRMRMTMEVIDAIRKAVGSDFVVGIRIPADDLVPGGLTLNDWKEIAQLLEATGKIDYIHIGHPPYIIQTTVGCGMQVPLGFHSAYAAEFKEAVSLPVINTFRINDPIQAEKILADGHGDMVGMTRGLIADPEWPNKAREKRIEEIRYCIACNQGCLGRLFEGKPMSCLQNPVVGLEKEIGTLAPASPKKKVLVVGGGPAGMEAARVARFRGHEVILYEKEEELGGQVSIAMKASGRSEFVGITRYLAKQMEILGVKIHTGVEVTPEIIEREQPHAVVVATGSQPVIPPLPGMEQANVINERDAISGKAEIGNKVVVLDGGEAHWKFLSVIEHLTDMGKQVEAISPLLFIGMGLMSSPDLGAYQRRVLNKGVVFSPSTSIKAVSGNTVSVFNVYTQAERKIENVDTVVSVMGNRADNQLYYALKDKVKELYAVGDCAAPRKAIDAIYEGYNIGRII
ncbi:MAG: FAD-dependent oxidoreductase [Proteobacteria bacterium]|nr:FAD-dependent oxidoreductase [Pseudomonadota bacterium]